MTPARPAFDSVSLAPLSFWAKSAAEKEHDFRILRDERPVSWHPPAEGSMLPPPEDGDFWAITRHADVLAVSKRPKDFCSGQGVHFEEIPQEVIEAASSFLAMDAPRHTQHMNAIKSMPCRLNLTRTPA
jgi:cytochrome P450